jgi:seryl-tRNA synthetase
MHNIKDIRNDVDNFNKALQKRFIKLDLEKILILDENNRKYIQEREILEQEKKEISKSKDKSLFEKSKSISIKIDKITQLQFSVKKELDAALSSIPNIPNIDVPVGKDENSNIEVSKSGKIPVFKFKPKSHHELGENLEMLDFDLATKTTGSRFVFVKGKLALLERALSNFMLDTHVNTHGYNEISLNLLLFSSISSNHHF